MPPTGQSAAADYVYVMDFDGDKIRHMTKIWNDGITLRQLGWATTFPARIPGLSASYHAEIARRRG